MEADGAPDKWHKTSGVILSFEHQASVKTAQYKNS